MKILKQSTFWISLISGRVFFILIYPYQHDMYIAPIHTMIRVMLNGASVILFAVILYLILRKKFVTEDYGSFLWLLIMQGVGHGVFAFMNWGSWACLGITAFILFYMAAAYVGAKNETQK